MTWDDFMIIRQKTKQTNKNQTVSMTWKTKDCERKEKQLMCSMWHKGKQNIYNHNNLLDFKEIQPVHSEGDQSLVFIGRTDAKTDTPILWLPHVKS